MPPKEPADIKSPLACRLTTPESGARASRLRREIFAAEPDPGPC